MGLPRAWAWLMLLAAVSSGCHHGEPTMTPAAPDSMPPLASTPGGAQVDPSLTPFVNQAIADLARRLGIDSSTVTVLEAQAVVWPDASYGCPQPGMGYAQVQQEGFLIRLLAQGRAFPYHGGGTRRPFLCETQG